jgi:hypothetical protein
MARCQACASVWSAAGHLTVAGRRRAEPVLAPARGSFVPICDVRVAGGSTSRSTAEEADA